VELNQVITRLAGFQIPLGPFVYQGEPGISAKELKKAGFTWIKPGVETFTFKGGAR
jgi:hypothetical protein